MKGQFRYLMRRKIWRGQFGWRHGKPGEKIWDYETTFYDSAEAVQAAASNQGCDCCARTPKKLKWGVWYRCGYGDRIVIRREPQMEKKKS